MSLKTGKIYICGEIETKTATAFLYKTDWLISRENKDIKIYINSIGGDVAASLAIVDRINLLKDWGATITTIGTGEVISAATFILVEASEKRRFATNNTTLMLHPIIHDLGKDYHKFISQYAKFHDSFYNDLMADLAIKCGIKNPKGIKDFMHKIADSVWLNVDDAIKFGVIDGIWEQSMELNNGINRTSKE
jgi:ATP-dependent protease ClpP protease subunit